MDNTGTSYIGMDNTGTSYIGMDNTGTSYIGTLSNVCRKETDIFAY